MEFHRLWRVLRAYSAVIVIVPVSASVCAVAMTYALPHVYEATSLVIVQPNEKIRLGSNQGRGKEMLDFPVSQAAPVDAAGNTYMEALQSEAVAARVVTALGLDAAPQVRNTSTLVRLRDEFKFWLRNTVRSWRHIVRYGRVIPATWFEQAVEDFRENLTLKGEKNTYAFSISFKSGDPQVAAAVANKTAEIFVAQNAEAFRSEAEASSKFIEARLAESEAVLLEARQALQGFKNEAGVFAIGDEYRERMKVISRLEVDAETTEARVAGLLQFYAPETGKVASAQAQVKGLRKALAAYKADVIEMPERERRLGELELAVTVAQQEYETLRRKYEESRIAEQTSVAEIRTVSPATVPLYPIKPIKYQYGGLAFLLGLVSSIALALFLEYLNPRVRVPDDLTTVLSTPLLAAVPVMKPTRVRQV